MSSYTYKTEVLKEKINNFVPQGLPFFFAVDYELSEGIFIDNPLMQNSIYFKFLNQGNKPEKQCPDTQNRLSVFSNGIKKYKARFDKAYTDLDQGTVDVINLTDRTLIDPGMPLEDIFIRSQAPYQIYWPNKLVCFSPERFVKISENGIISSNPMKGTIDASIPNAEELILHDPKEIAEHTATVNLVVNELNVVATEVEITRFRYINRIESKNRTLLQVSSEISGKLFDGYKSQLGDILFKLLPAGSIAGTPKKEALEVIKKAEGESRGYYCGIAGYFDGKVLDTAVLIRFIELDNGKNYFRSGGGITKDSCYEKEYQEILNKIYLPF